jgi:hypothetical protein
MVIATTFERGNHTIGYHDNLSDPLYVLNYTMLLAPTHDMQCHESIYYDMMISQCTRRK